MVTRTEFETMEDGDFLAEGFFNGIQDIYNITGKNLIRTLIDRSGVFSTDEKDMWGDAYIDIDGREDSVSNTYVDAYNGATDSYHPIIDGANLAGSDTDNTSGAWTNESYAFDKNSSNKATRAQSDSGSGPLSWGDYIGKTFTSARTIKYVKVFARAELDGSVSTTGYNRAYLQTYNGTIWTTVETLFSDSWSQDQTDEYDDIYTLNASVQGVRILFDCYMSGGSGLDGTISARIDYGDYTTTIIRHDIPTGTFSDTINSVIGITLYENLVTGSDVQYKLVNAGEDTGWLDCGINPLIESFTTFTTEPTILYVRLIPDTTTPTATSPSIKGFVIRAT